MHLLIIIDAPRLDEDRRALQAIAMGLRDASIEQTHILATQEEDTPVEPLLDTVDPVQTAMPARWWRRSTHAAAVAEQVGTQPIDAIFWSGDAAAVLARDLAATFEVPLIGDTWRAEQVQNASRTPWIDTWIARTDRIGELLRRAVNHGRIVTARPPVDLKVTPRIPGTRPTMIVLDPGQAARDSEYIVDAVAHVTAQRPDVELFFELRGGSGHRLWKKLRQHRLLDRTTVLDHVGWLTPLVARASIVVAPDPSGPARSLLPLSMCGGAAVVAASDACEELLIHDDTSLVLTPGDARAWASALGSLLTDPALRQRLATSGSGRARIACRPDTAMAAWITAVTASVEPASYPIVST